MKTNFESKWQQKEKIQKIIQFKFLSFSFSNSLFLNFATIYQINYTLLLYSFVFFLTQKKKCGNPQTSNKKTSKEKKKNKKLIYTFSQNQHRKTCSFLSNSLKLYSKFITNAILMARIYFSQKISPFYIL